MFDLKKEKKLHKFKLYHLCKMNGKVCLFNKFHSYLFMYNNGRLYLNVDYIRNYSDVIGDIIYYCGKGKIVQRELHNEYSRYLRCRNRIENMFIDSKNLFFITFTISNMYYDKYYENQDNFTRYIKKCLNGMSCIDWCFNLDFGSQNDRLHAHAIISHTDSILDLQKFRSLYRIGNIDVAKTYNDNSIALEKYLTKFTNHSFKNTTLCRVSYSRNQETAKRYYQYNLEKGANKYN